MILVFFRSQRIGAHLLTILLIIIMFCFTAPLWTVLSMTYNCFSCLTQWVWGSSWIVRSQRCFVKLEIKRSGHISRLLCNRVQGLSGLHGEIGGLRNESWGLRPLVDFITEHSFSNYSRVFQAAPCLHKFAGCFWNFFKSINITSYRKWKWCDCRCILWNSCMLPLGKWCFRLKT